MRKLQQARVAGIQYLLLQFLVKMKMIQVNTKIIQGEVWNINNKNFTMFLRAMEASPVNALAPPDQAWINEKCFTSTMRFKMQKNREKPATKVLTSITVRIF